MNIYSPYEVDLQELLSSEKVWKVFADKFIKLPAGIKSILISSTTTSYLENLCNNYGLDQNQASNLSRLLRDVLLANTFWGDFPSLISSRLGVDSNTANQIVKMLADELLAPALENIKTTQRAKFADRIAQGKTNPTQQAPQAVENTSQGNVINLRNRDDQ